MAATGHHQIAVLTRLPKTFKIADRLVGIEQGVVDALDKKRIDPGYSLAVATLTGAINTPTMFRQLCLQFLGHTSLPALVKQLIDPRGYPSLTQATRIQVGQPEAFSNTTGCKAVSQIMPGHRRYDDINPRVHQTPGQLEAAGITQPKATHPWVTILLLAKMMSIVGIHPIDDCLGVLTFQGRILQIHFAATFAKSASVERHHKIAGLPGASSNLLQNIVAFKTGRTATSPTMAIEQHRCGLSLRQLWLK